MKRLQAALTDANQNDDISPLLTPEQRLWALLMQATQGNYCDRIPRWAWVQLWSNQKPNMNVLGDAFRRYRNDSLK